MRTIKDVKWGVTIAAAQTEGAYQKDEKQPSIWDVFTEKKYRIKDRSDAKVATDFYHRYKEDIDIAVDIGLQVFRFSVAWTRVFDARGSVNPKGIKFYNRVIDYCIEVGIEPWITVYHWDLPQKLQEDGGWKNRDILPAFESYVRVLKKHFTDRVKHWIIVNEAIVCIGAGYFLGIHAPGKRGMKPFSAAIHHILLAQARGYRILKQNKDLQVGTAVSCTKIEAFSDKKKDEQAAKRVDALMNRLCIEPHLGMGYPVEDLTIAGRIDRFVLEGDLEELKVDFDFWGIQTYAREFVKSAWYIPYLGAVLVSPRKRKVPVSVMGWETYPEGTTFFLERFAKYDPQKPLWLSECGMALSDTEDDELRIAYYKKVIDGMDSVLKKGVNLQGILLWTLVDNFEWAEGYVPKFGIISLNRKTLQRTYKKTAFWLKKYLLDH